MLLCAVFAAAQSHGVLGLWQAPGGSVIDVHSCGKDVCARLVSIAPNAPSPFDIHNPDRAQRTRRLCGLQIGWGFHPNGPDHATDGTLYDPKTGKTYHGKMTAAGDRLDLRGYIGLSLFGRTEVWTRTNRAPPPCPH
jgi:uncharacterized protein (DUF2147 family)